MESLVQDLLKYTQVMAVEADSELTDANDALAQTLRSLDGAITSSQATIVAEPLPMVHIHGSHLQQILQNLIGNGIKYCSPERLPLIRVDAERLHDCWVFAVSDNGIGIAPQYREKIFGLFKRLHTDDKYSGTGIGLSICRRLIEQYGGRIWVESSADGGSAFRFTIPDHPRR